MKNTLVCFTEHGENITAQTLSNSITGTELHVPWSQRFSFFFFHPDQIFEPQSVNELTRRGASCCSFRSSPHTLPTLLLSQSLIQGRRHRRLRNKSCKPATSKEFDFHHALQRILIHCKMLGPNFSTKRVC